MIWLPILAFILEGVHLAQEKSSSSGILKTSTLTKFPGTSVSGTQYFFTYRCNLKLLGFRVVAGSKFLTQGSQTLGATAQNSVPLNIRSPGFVFPYTVQNFGASVILQKVSE